VTLSFDRLVQRFTGGAGNRILSGGINLREDQPVGTFKSFQLSRIAPMVARISVG
jgi:hypothetical protein